ncbi:MAG: site-specific integrase [Clostridia bacterium]|nr:MAG: site-specific integrase [Clostridia bacterium]
MGGKRGNNEGSVTQRSDGRWQGAVTTGRDPATGKLKRVFFYGATREEAARKVTAALAEVQRGTFVEPTKLTVGQWLETWLVEYKKTELRPTTWDSYEITARVHIKPAVGELKLKDLRPEHLQRLYNEKAKAGLSPKTVTYIHTVIHGALGQAVKNGLVIRNVAEATTLPRKVKKEIRPLTLEEVKQLFDAIEQDRLFPAIYLELATGLRRGELLGLRWQDVNLKAGTITVKQGLVRVRNHEAQEGERKTMLVFQELKTATARRTIPIPEDVLAELKRWKARQNEEKLALGQGYRDNGLVFCAEDGQPLDPRSFTRHFDQMLKCAGLPHIRFHDARHTFATMMLELGESPKVVQQMLGHSQIAVTLDIYSHVSLDLERKAAARLNEVLKKEKAPSAR